MTKIHPTALVEDGAQLGLDVEIGPFCMVGPNVSLGDGCRLLSHSVVEGHTEVGAGNVFYPFTLVGAAPQDLKYHGERTGLKIGARNTFRENVSVHRGTPTGRGETVIGDDNLFMGYVHVAHDCVLGSRNILANYTGLSGHVTIDDHVTLGGQNGVIQFVHIGSHCYFGAGTMVDKSVAPYTTGYGNRIQIKGINIIGLRRRGFSREEINQVMEAHKIFFREGLSEAEALDKIEREYGASDKVMFFVDFIRKAEGGVKR